MRMIARSIILMFFVAVFALSRNADAQVIQQDLVKEYDQEKKKLESQSQNQNQGQSQDQDQGIEIGGPPPAEQDYSTLSQQDADTILEAAQALNEDNPELARKLLDIGK